MIILDIMTMNDHDIQNSSLKATHSVGRSRGPGKNPRGRLTDIFQRWNWNLNPKAQNKK